MMELGKTVGMMESRDYKERFVAEYMQLSIRLRKLKMFVAKIYVSEHNDRREEIKHDCPTALLEEQIRVMERYKEVLEHRAAFENINLDECEYCDKNEKRVCQNACNTNE